MITEDILNKAFFNVQNIGNGIFKGEKYYQDKLYSITYIDTSDNVVEISENLNSFQEETIGTDYYELQDQLRWNNYYYFVVSNKSLIDSKFQIAKQIIESNKDFARKYVVTQSEFEKILEDSLFLKAEATLVIPDVIDEWTKLLNNNDLSSLLEKPYRTDAIANIVSANAQVEFSHFKPADLSDEDELLTNSHLKRLSIDSFRGAHEGKTFEFGNINLIYGPNGVGKTSLLEAIEFLYCGFNRRQDKQVNHKVRGQLVNNSKNPIEIRATKDASRLKTRNLAWYKRDSNLSKNIISGFSRYNFLDTDAAFRISTELNPSELMADLSLILMGSDASALWTYFGKLKDDLETYKKEIKNDLGINEDRIVALNKDINRLQALPSQASVALKNYLASVKKIPWNEKHEGIISNLDSKARKTFETIISQIIRIKSSIPDTSLSIKQIKKSLESIERLNDKVEKLEKERALIEDEFISKVAHLNEENIVINILSEWKNYAKYNYNKTILDLDKSSEEIVFALEAIGSLDMGPLDDIAENYSSLPILKAYNFINTQIYSSEERVQKLTSAHELEQRRDQSIIKIKNELQNLVLHYLDVSNIEDFCPVCHTEHEPDELKSKVMALAELDEAESYVTIAILRDTEIDELNKLKDLKNIFELLLKFCEKINLNKSEITYEEVRLAFQIR